MVSGGYRLLAVISVVVLLLLPAAAFAGRDMIGLYADESASDCEADLQPYVNVDVFVVATLSSIDGLMAVEFKLDNYPSGGIITPNWNSPLVIGDPAEDVAIAFNDTQYGSTVILGSLGFMSITGNWPGSDYVVTVVGGDFADIDAPIIVDEDAEENAVLGGRFTFNCTNDANCGCGDGSTADQTISALKQTY
jgi:hypothetical protein